ncbi:MAG: T9SS type A sorting domain-containing protein [Chitinophagaceae bacterium]
MRKSLLIFSFLLTILNIAYSQADRFAYVITDNVQEGVNWNVLRKIDLQSNTYSDVLLNGNDANPLAFDAATKKQFTTPFTDARFGTVANAAFGTGVAAIAYDKANSRLYYTPMLIDQLRYIDLKTMKVYFVGGFANDALKTKAPDQSNIITRMAIASDGNGYALTNDGNHLIQFTTGKKIKVTDLGPIVDDQNNKTVSVHNSCSSFGGDMIADDNDNLYVFSARNQVFKVNIESKVATHLGAISGLPAGFTTNGAAVGSDNKILLVSATNNNALYTLDNKTWTAAPIKSSIAWRSSDLANSNLLATRKSAMIPSVLTAVADEADTRIGLYPNPTIGKQFTVQFNQPEGNYIIQVTDALGRQTIRANANIKGKGQTESIQLPEATKRGVYLVKVVDQNKLTIFSRKIVVQ